MTAEVANPSAQPQTAGAMTPEKLREAVGQLDWFHSIDLGYGVVTPGRDRSADKLSRLRLPDDLSGRTVLDVGAWDGFFSFAMERRGAKRVLATDSWAWLHMGGRPCFELARDALGSRVEDRTIDVMDLCPDDPGVFDVVLFLGVLYHLRHPLLALERLAAVTGDLLVLETHVDLLFARRPAVAFYAGEELNRDASNFCGPNPPAVLAMLRAAGFRRAEVVWRDPLTRRVGRTVRNTFRGANPWKGIQQGRVVVHAHKD